MVSRHVSLCAENLQKELKCDLEHEQDFRSTEFVGLVRSEILEEGKCLLLVAFIELGLAFCSLIVSKQNRSWCRADLHS